MAALGVLLIVGGAIIAWSVDAFASGFEFQAIGYLMMAGGAIASAFAAISGAGWLSQTTDEPTDSTERQRSVEQSRN